MGLAAQFGICCQSSLDLLFGIAEPRFHHLKMGRLVSTLEGSLRKKETKFAKQQAQTLHPVSYYC